MSPSDKRKGHLPSALAKALSSSLSPPIGDHRAHAITSGLVQTWLSLPVCAGYLGSEKYSSSWGKNLIVPVRIHQLFKGASQIATAVLAY